MKGLKPKGKIFGLFGSHGWGGGAVKEMRRSLIEEKFEVWEKDLQIQYVPTPEELETAIQFGKEFAKNILGN
jgi:anaerobic nitric oxide reductase flavorubredoxin